MLKAIGTAISSGICRKNVDFYSEKEHFNNRLAFSLNGMLDKDSCRKITNTLYQYRIRLIDNKEVAESNKSFLQMVAQGIIYLEDLNMICEYYPRLSRDIANHMRLTTAQFRDMAYSRTLGLEVLLCAIRDLEVKL